MITETVTLYTQAVSQSVRQLTDWDQ